MADDEDLEYLAPPKPKTERKKVDPQKNYISPPKNVNDFQLYEPANSKSSFKQAIKENPLVPLGVITIFGAIGRGLMHTLRGNDFKAGRMMELRVGAQIFTIIALVGGLKYHHQKLERERTEAVPK